MKRYSDYKDSGVEWIGEIPSHWDVKKIKHIASIFGRIGFRGYTVEDIVDEGEGAITLSPSNILNQKIVLDKLTYLSWQKYNESPEIKIYNDDVVFVKTGSTVGKVAHIENLQQPATLNPQLIVFKNLKIKSKLLYYNLTSSIIQDSVKLSTSGSVIPTLTQNEIGNYNLVIPSAYEQDCMIDYLDKKTSQIEDLISKKEELIETLKASRTKLISETVTKGLDKNLPMKDSGVEWIGEIPSHWKIKRLKYVTDITMGQSPDSSDYNFEEYGYPFLQGNAEFTQKSPIPKVYCEKAKKYSRFGDILMSVRAPVGAINISNQIYGIGRGLCSISCLKISKEYMWYAMPIFINELKINSKGTTYESVTMDDVNNMTCIVPPLNEQINISQYLDVKVIQIDEIILKAQEQIDILKKAKQKLITEVVTGKIDVTNL